MPYCLVLVCFAPRLDLVMIAIWITHSPTDIKNERLAVLGSRLVRLNDNFKPERQKSPGYFIPTFGLIPEMPRLGPQTADPPRIFATSVTARETVLYS